MDAMQRIHQCATVQLDFVQPMRFDLSYQAPPKEGADAGNDARRTLAGRQLGIDKALADADTALRECEDMRREAETARRRAAEAEEKAAFAQAEVARASAREESALAAEKRRNRGRIENLERRSEAAERARRQSDQVGL